MRVGLVGQKDNRRAASLVAEICERLRALNAEPRIDEATAGQLAADALPEAAPAGVSTPVETMADCDLVVSIGGDGTFLFAARGAGSTPVMGVNLGEVGFLNAVPPEAAVEAVASEVADYQETGAIETRDMPRVSATGEGWSLPPALNEIVVQGPYRGHGGGIDLEVRVDGSLYTSGYADGVLLATPTGSTAYNLSEGGPLVHPSVPAFVVTEMCAAESMPPLTVGTDSEITVRLEDAEAGYVVSDGRVREEIDPPTAVSLARASEPVRIAGPPLDFFAALGKLE